MSEKPAHPQRYSKQGGKSCNVLHYGQGFLAQTYCPFCPCISRLAMHIMKTFADSQLAWFHIKLFHEWKKSSKKLGPITFFFWEYGLHRACFAPLYHQLHWQRLFSFVLVKAQCLRVGDKVVKRTRRSAYCLAMNARASSSKRKIKGSLTISQRSWRSSTSFCRRCAFVTDKVDGGGMQQAAGCDRVQGPWRDTMCVVRCVYRISLTGPSVRDRKCPSRAKVPTKNPTLYI